MEKLREVSVTPSKYNMEQFLTQYFAALGPAGVICGLLYYLWRDAVAKLDAKDAKIATIEAARETERQLNQAALNASYEKRIEENRNSFMGVVSAQSGIEKAQSAIDALAQTIRDDRERNRDRDRG